MERGTEKIFEEIRSEMYLKLTNPRSSFNLKSEIKTNYNKDIKFLKTSDKV